jgi:magnesium-transporting ATPase (P-type)
MPITINKRELLLLAVYIDIILFMVCLMVFGIMSYPTALKDIEPYKTIRFLQNNPIMQTICVITFVSIAIIIIHDHFSKKPILGDNKNV